MSEAILVDRARADDHVEVLSGRPPAAEAALRAVLSGRPTEPAVGETEDVDGDDGAASITDLAAWVEQANRLMGGRG